MKKLIGEFKEFISRGNVFDMAVGVVIGGAFGKITGSLVNDLIMPAIGALFGTRDLTALNLVIRPAELNEAGDVVTEAVSLGIGTFIATIIDFLLIALAVFAMIKAVNTLKKKFEKPAEPEEEKEPEPSKEELLLGEIRDLLKENKQA